MKRLLKFIIWFSGLACLAVAGMGAYLAYVWSSNLPVIDAVKEYRPPIITEIYSDGGEVIGRLWEEQRIVVSLKDLPEHLIRAFVAAEDARFFEHEGVDLKSIFRALIRNIQAGKIEQGGSTITQQVTRALLLRNTKRTYRRKAREALLSIQLEKGFSKEQILFLYLNEIYLGRGAYGVEAASRTYFRKPAKDLTVAEAAMLAGLPQAPARYSPVLHFNRAKVRQRYVLQRMQREGYITAAQVKEAEEAPLEIREDRENTFQKAPHFTEHVRKYLEEKYGSDILYRGGLKVYTTLDLPAQQAARDALNKGLADLDKREGYRGPVRHLTEAEIPAYLSEQLKKRSAEPAVIGSVVEALVEAVDDEKKEVVVRIGSDLAHLPLEGMKWARKPDPEVPYYAAKLRRPSEALKPGDIILAELMREGSLPYRWEVALAQIPEIEGALLCMVPRTGEVKAMVGGKDFSISQFNRAIQARRQPGSAFKPIIYAAAIDWGMSPAEIIIDAPYVSDQNLADEVWKPKNYKGKFFGPTLFRTALAKSRNVITVKILKKIGVNYAIQYARKLGIESELSPDLSLALGSSGISLMELTRAYAIFANGGMMPTPIFIKRIEDRGGQVIEENQPQATEAISQETAYVMTDLLKAVVQEGTGWRIRALKRPVAGKTGTTNNLWDAWFMGYTPDLVTGVWVGYDDRRAMGKGETGSRAASPIWLSFMSRMLEEKPVVDFDAPEGVVFAKIDAKTGLLASADSEKTVFQAFKAGTQPNQYSTRPTPDRTDPFMQFDMDKQN